jgi:hypothetical protein
MHHHSLRSRPRHSDPRSGETSALRLARLAANLGNGIIQQTPSQDSDYPTTSFCGPESLPGFRLVVYDRAGREGIRRKIR